jgi:CheY-like chemotaxis protein
LPFVVQWSVILLVEDNSDDADLLEIALRKALGEALNIRHFPDARLAVGWLSHLPVADPLPCLVLCDLHLPGMDGLSLLTWIKSHPRFGSLPVYMLTGSENPLDSDRALLERADGYLLKPREPELWTDRANTIARLRERCRAALAPCDDASIFRQACAAAHADPAAVKGDSQEQHVVAARRRVASRLMDLGLPLRRVASLLPRSTRTLQRSIAKKAGAA